MGGGGGLKGAREGWQKGELQRVAVCCSVLQYTCERCEEGLAKSEEMKHERK